MYYCFWAVVREHIVMRSILEKKILKSWWLAFPREIESTETIYMIKKMDSIGLCGTLSSLMMSVYSLER